MLLEARNLHIGYGDASAVWDVSLDVDGWRDRLGDRTQRRRQDDVDQRHRRLAALPAGRTQVRRLRHEPGSAHAYCGHGIALVPEGRRLFAKMSVEENLELGCYLRVARAERAPSLERVYGLFPILRDKRRQPAGELSGGQQQMVAIGRALMARPRIVLFDEPSLGLAPTVVDDMFDIIARVRADGAAVLLVEQNVLKALDVADRAYVLEQGRIVAQGLPGDLLKQPHIREAYLGV